MEAEHNVDRRLRMKLVYLTLCILPAGVTAADVLPNPVNTIRLEHAFAPGSNIPKWQNGLLITSEDHRVPASRSLSQALIVLALYTPNSKEWIEIANSGAVLGLWKGLDLRSDPKDLRVTGAALTPEGSVYVSAVLRRSGSSSPSTQFHTLDRKTGTWLAVDASSLLGPGGVGFAAILGNDGGNLVINAGRSTIRPTTRS